MCVRFVYSYAHRGNWHYWFSVFLAASVDSSGTTGGAEGSQGDEQSPAPTATAGDLRLLSRTPYRPGPQRGTQPWPQPKAKPQQPAQSWTKEQPESQPIQHLQSEATGSWCHHSQPWLWLQRCCHCAENQSSQHPTAWVKEQPESAPLQSQPKSGGRAQHQFTPALQPMPGAWVWRLLLTSSSGSTRRKFHSAAVGARAAGQGAVFVEENHGGDGDENRLSETDARRPGWEHPEAAGDAPGPRSRSRTLGSGTEDRDHNHGSTGGWGTAGEHAFERGMCVFGYVCINW